MAQSNHFSSELVKMSPDQLDGVLPCVPGGHGMFDLSAEARCGSNLPLTACKIFSHY